MVPHRHVLPVGQQRVVRVAEHLAHVPGVILAGVKICVIAHLHRHVHVHLVHRHQARRVGVCSVTQFRTVRLQQRLDALAQRDSHRLPKLHQRVQGRCSQHLRVDLHTVQESQGVACAQVHDMVSQTHPGTGAAA